MTEQKRVLMTVIFEDGTSVNVVTPEKAEDVRRYLLGGKKLKGKTRSHHFWTLEQEEKLAAVMAGYSSISEAKETVQKFADVHGFTFNAVASRCYRLKLVAKRDYQKKPVASKEPITV